MERIQLAGEKRDSAGKGDARKLRAKGLIPAIAYGTAVEQPVSVSVNRHELVKILNGKLGKNTQFDLVVGDVKYPIIVRDYQIHPVSRVLMHCDFLVLDADKPVSVEIPVITVGKAPAEEVGAKLFLARREVKVSCLPSAMPDLLQADISALDPGDVLYVDQLVFPEGVVPIYRARYPVVVANKLKSADSEAAGTDEEDIEAAAAAAAESGEDGAKAPEAAE